MFNIHDNEITSYKIDLKKKKIKMYFEEDIENYEKRKKIIFFDVLAHFFEDEVEGSIILSIDKCEINQFISDNIDLLKEKKDYCWPIDYDTIDELTNKLEYEKYYYYVISSAYGLNGWILAKDYQIK